MSTSIAYEDRVRREYDLLRRHIRREIRTREKRAIFRIMRDEGVSETTFIPSLGMTLGEFSVSEILLNRRRSSK